MFVPEVNFKFLIMEKEIGPLCTGGCEKLVYMAEILVTLSVLREPAKNFWKKMCCFDVTDFEKTLLSHPVEMKDIQLLSITYTFFLGET